MAEKILEVTGLNKHFRGLQATKDLDFHLFEGDQAAIIGPNGAGKSTFFNLLTGYHRVDSGTILFQGKDITNMPSHEIARGGITRAFQVSNIFPKLTVIENIRSAVQAQMGHAFDFFSRADDVGVGETERILKLCGLSGKEELMAGELSQGDKKKLELALALAGKPKLLLLDEPTAGMSLEETRETMALIDDLNRKLNLTILFTEHDMSVVFNHARRVTLLHRGEKIIEGTPQEVRQNETAQRIYLGEHK
ncbi:MAG TPA: ABC transporter ATP-binding protein [Thermodesulfobacteriota bacterium]|nr:ABC transporter ATP-binding protein [Thermodesulfobacteriota bacterium]